MFKDDGNILHKILFSEEATFLTSLTTVRIVTDICHFFETNLPGMLGEEEDGPCGY